MLQNRGFPRRQLTAYKMTNLVARVVLLRYMGSTIALWAERMVLMRDFAVVLPIGGLAAILTNPAFGAVPAAAQIAAAAGRSDLTVLNMRRLPLPETGREAYEIKARTADGKFQSLTVDGAGNPTDRSALLQAEALASQQHYGNLKPRLFQEVQTKGPDDLVPVHIWAKASITYPRKEDILANSALRAAFQAQLKQNLSAAVEPIITWLNSNKSVTLAQLTSNDLRSPHVSALVPASLVQEIGKLPNVAWVDLQTPVELNSTTWYQATNVASARATTTGQGVTGCVVEDAQPDDASWLRVAGTRDSSGYVDSVGHVRHTMDVLSNTFGNETSVTDNWIYMGNVPIVDVNNINFTPGWQWCMNQGARVINNSFWMGDIQGYEVDYFTKIWPYPLMVLSSGKDTTVSIYASWSYNGLVVGASDDNGTVPLLDDRISGQSPWKNPTWAPDFEVPHLAAPAICVDVADTDCLDGGTSIAAPQAAGAAMLVMSRNPSLQGWPEPTRAILTATAIADLDGDRFSHLGNGAADRMGGVGQLDTGKAVALADSTNVVSCNNTARSKGTYYATMDFPTDFTNGMYNCGWNLLASSNGRMRVVATWDATAACDTSTNTCSSDAPDADLDMYVWDMSTGQQICDSNSYGSSWEGCEFPVTAGNTYLVNMALYSQSQPRTYFGLAWSDIPAPATPTQAASSIRFFGQIGPPPDPNSQYQMSVTWQPGDGDATAVFVAESGTGTPAPEDGTVYLQDLSSPLYQGHSNSIFGQGSQIGTSGWYCVYNGTGSYVIVGLPRRNSTYRVMAVTYRDSGTGMPTYLATSGTLNPRNYPPLATYSVPATPLVDVLGLGILLCAVGLHRMSRKRA